MNVIQRPGPFALLSALILALILSGLASGCQSRPSGRTAPPDAASTGPGAQAGPDRRGQELTARLLLTEPDRQGGPDLTVAPTLASSSAPTSAPTSAPGAATAVGTGPLIAVLAFDSVPDRQWVESDLLVQSGTDDRLKPQAVDRQWLAADRLEIRLPPGPPGQRVEVRLPSALPQPIAFTLFREAPVRADMAILGYHYQWPDPVRTTLPVLPGPVTVEFRFSRAVDIPSVEAALANTLHQAVAGAPPPIEFHWQGQDLLRLNLEAPVGTRVALDLKGARDANGRPLAAGTPPLVVWQEPARLTALDVDGAAPWVLATVPHRVVGGKVSPDGHWVAYLEDAGSGAPYLWLLNVPTVQTYPTAIRPRDVNLLFWSPDGQELLAGEADQVVAVSLPSRSVRTVRSGAYVGMARSPDGTRLAVLLPSNLPVQVEGMTGMVLMATDAVGRSVYSEQLRLPPVPAGGHIPITWRNDGRWLVVGASPSGPDSVLVLGLGDGGRRELPLEAPLGNGPLAWSPVDDRLVAGDRVVDILAGETIQRLSGAVGPAFWRRNGNALLWRQQDGRARVTGFGHPDGSPGSGPIVGWLPSGHVLMFQS